MNLKIGICFLFLFFVFNFMAMSETLNGLPIHVKNLSGRAIRLWIGDYISSTAVSAINTDKGIVVIDTTQCSTLDQEFRKIIAAKFGKKNFIYLINTHEHGDHTLGNSTYADCQIIAQEKCAEGMKKIENDRQRVSEWTRDYILQQEKLLAAAKPDSEEYKKIKEDITIQKMELDVFKSPVKPVFPTKTFRDEMTLPLGNITLKLYYMGGLHTASDIFVWVPEEGLLFSGDVMADTWLTDTPGCLQSFGGRPGLKRDIPLLLKNWKTLLDLKEKIKDFVPGHWNGDLTYQGFADRYQYMTTLVDEVKKASAENKKFETVLADLSLKTRFPELSGKPGFAQEFSHITNIKNLWTEITGAVSGSDTLAELIRAKGPDQAVAGFEAGYMNSPKYYLIETEFNLLGYRFINEKNYPAAIAVLKINTRLYPNSFNTFDSLGEAYMKQGDKKLALENYQKAAQLNPQSTVRQKEIYTMQLKTIEDLKK